MRRALCFPSLSTSYLLPAIFLNPSVFLHLLNTAISHLRHAPSAPSISPHPRLEGLGPLPGSTLYFDMHANDKLCWKYTTLMVIVQILVVWKVQENRGKEREGELRLQVETDTTEGRMVEKARCTPRTGSWTEFDLEVTINGQETKKEVFLRHAGQVSKIRADTFVAEGRNNTSEAIEGEGA